MFSHLTSGERAAAVAAALALRQAMAALAVTLRDKMETVDQEVAGLLRDTPAADVLGDWAAGSRAELTESLVLFQTARLRHKEALARLMVAEGRTPTDIGKVMGISRQQATKLARPE